MQTNHSERKASVAVTGARGFVGRRLVEALLGRGHAVRALVRRDTGDLPAPVVVVTGDLTDERAALDRFVDGIEVVFHCAGQLRDPSTMRALHVDGTRRLAHALRRETARAARPVRWVQLSSAGVYGPPQKGPSEERVVTEATAPHPIGEYETTKSIADEVVISEAAERGARLSVAVLRPTGIVGRGMPNASLRALGSVIHRRLFAYPGKPGAIANYVHVDDVVDALLVCGFDARAGGQIFNLSNDCSLEALIKAIARAVHAPPPRRRIPEAPLRALARAAAMFGSFPLTDQRINALVGRTRYSSARLATQLQFVPTRGVPETIGELF